MSKKFGKLLFATAAIGTAAAAAYYFMKKNQAENAAQDVEPVDFDEDETEEITSNYVSLTPEAKETPADMMETAAEELQEAAEEIKETAEDAFTPLKDTLSEAAEDLAENVEEFFDENDFNDSEEAPKEQ